MGHEIMTIEEVAEYIRVSERTVYDWAQKGQIPGGKLGTTWRFKRSEIEDWVNRNLGSDSPKKVTNKEGLAKILDKERVVFFDSASKDELLKALCSKLSSSSLIHSPHELEKAIFRREELMSTGIGFGIGVPHVRIGSVGDIVMALGVVREPIADYKSLDSIPVQIVCMVAAGASQHSHYIRVLSKISSRLREDDIRSSIIQAADADEAYRIFVGEE